MSLPDAAYRGDLARLRALLAGGADVDAVDKDGDTALICAAFKGHLGCVRELLRAGAQVDRGREDD